MLNFVFSAAILKYPFVPVNHLFYGSAGKLEIESILAMVKNIYFNGRSILNYFFISK